MPYKSDKIKVSGTQYDRRVKLTEEQRTEIKSLYGTGTYSHRKLASMFSVSKSLIAFVINPDQDESNKRLAKANRKGGKYKQSKEAWASTIREHRRYKQELYLQDKIKSV